MAWSCFWAVDVVGEPATFLEARAELERADYPLSSLSCAHCSRRVGYSQSERVMGSGVAGPAVGAGEPS